LFKGTKEVDYQLTQKSPKSCLPSLEPLKYLFINEFSPTTATNNMD